MLSEEQKRLLIGMIERGEPLPAEYRRLLFAQDRTELVERTGVYSLEYKGKAREQDNVTDTIASLQDSCELLDRQSRPQASGKAEAGAGVGVLRYLTGRAAKNGKCGFVV